MIIIQRIIITFLLVTFLYYAHAQSPEIDSINNLISKSPNDTERINLVIQKLKLLDAINIDSSIILSTQTLKETKRIKYYKAQIALRHILARNYSLKGDYKSAQENLTALEQLIKSSKDSAEYADLYGSYGVMYGINGSYDSAIGFLKKAVGIIERTGYTPTLIRYYRELGIDYQQQSNYTRGLFYYQAALKLAEKAKDEISQAYVLVNMAGTYTAMGDTPRSEQAYKKSITIAEKNSLRNVEAYAYSNLANLLEAKSEWKQAYELGMKAAAIGGAMGDQVIQSASLSKAARDLASMNKFTEAIQVARHAIIVADSSGQSFNISQAYSSMGNILFSQKKYSEAIPFYEKGIAVSNPDYFNEFTAGMYTELSECYEKTGNTGKALETYKKYDEIKDSTRSRENIQKATELTMNYDFEKKQAVAKAEQDKKDSEARRIKNQQYFTIAALAIVVLAVLIIALIQFRNSKQKQTANLLLERQKLKVENTLSELKSTQAQLIQSEKMASLGELTSGIAHEIQNPLNFVNNFSEVNNELIEEMQTELKSGKNDEAITISNSIKVNQDKIIFHGKRADAIVKGMLQHSRNSSNVTEPTDINALANEYLRLSYHGMRAKDKSFNATIKTDFDELIGNINIVPQDIGRVLLNLYNNAFYACTERTRSAVTEKNSMKNKNLSALPTAQAGSKEGYEPLISVSTKKTGNQVIIKVSDNGNGIPQKVVDKIFQPFFTTKPTGQGTGLGLSLSYDIIKAHGGEIKVETEEGGGSAFVIQLPIV